MNLKIAKAHIALLAAESMWGLMAPIGKSAMLAGITSLSLATMRMFGAAILFWIASLFTPKEKVNPHDLMLLFFAGLLSIVFNQGLFTFGLSLTSPIDASVVSTFLPIVTMILAALFLKEPITPKKVTGLFMGAIGALVLILSNHSPSTENGNMLGDILCISAQISFACYLTLFKKLISKYHIFTLMKWMFTYATLCFIPFAYNDFSSLTYNTFPPQVWWEVGYVILFGTFFAYILMLVGQKTLRPTVVSMYNYIQPIVGASVSIYIGIATFSWIKAFATFLIFAGVYVVTQSKSLSQMMAEKEQKTKIER